MNSFFSFTSESIILSPASALESSVDTFLLNSWHYILITFTRLQPSSRNYSEVGIKEICQREYTLKG